MKKICFVRHAKSSWKDLSLSDADRPLNSRGKRDAPFMAAHAKSIGVMPDVLISSPAKRAYSTAKKFAKVLEISKSSIIKEPKIYEAFSMELLALIQSFDDKYNHVMLFGHNPGFTSIVNYLNAPLIENVPTCGLVSISSSTKYWKQLDQVNCQFNFFKYPKMLSS